MDKSSIPACNAKSPKVFCGNLIVPFPAIRSQAYLRPLYGITGIYPPSSPVAEHGREPAGFIIPLPCAVNFAVEFHSRLGYTKGRKELNLMLNIKPISDLRNYSEVLRDVAIGAPVFLTKNRGAMQLLTYRTIKRYRQPSGR